MTDALSVGTRCESPLQIIGLLIVALLIIGVAIILYKAIRFVGVCILNYRKVDIDVDKGTFHAKAHLSQ